MRVWFSRTAPSLYLSPSDINQVARYQVIGHHLPDIPEPKILKQQAEEIEANIRKELVMVTTENASFEELEMLENHLGNVPEGQHYEIRQAVKRRRDFLEWEAQAETYYREARVKRTIRRGEKRTKELLKQYPRLVKLREYVGADGKMRRTVELELPSEDDE